MRCIEMVGTTEPITETSVINRNMRCIEMFYRWGCWLYNIRINRNMRCIEIIPPNKHVLVCGR